MLYPAGTISPSSICVPELLQTTVRAPSCRSMSASISFSMSNSRASSGHHFSSHSPPVPFSVRLRAYISPSHLQNCWSVGGVSNPPLPFSIHNILWLGVLQLTYLCGALFTLRSCLFDVIEITQCLYRALPELQRAALLMLQPVPWLQKPQGPSSRLYVQN